MSAPRRDPGDQRDPARRAALRGGSLHQVVLPMAQGRREVLLCPGYVVGAPVIALDNTAFPEFESGVACLLPAANVKTLVEGMARVLGDPELCRSIGDAGPHRAGSYDWRLITRRYLNLIVPLAREWEAA